MASYCLSNIRIVTCFATEGAVLFVNWFIEQPTSLATIKYNTVTTLQNL
jgi:hypothetical protein